MSLNEELYEHFLNYPYWLVPYFEYFADSRYVSMEELRRLPSFAACKKIQRQRLAELGLTKEFLTNLIQRYTQSKEAI